MNMNWPGSRWTTAFSQILALQGFPFLAESCAHALVFALVVLFRFTLCACEEFQMRFQCELLGLGLE
jgi:hypothetical protein